MATPYLQVRLGTTTSTQDEARDRLEDLPVLAIAAEQSRGRGRSDTHWLSAPRALAVSLAFRAEKDDTRPFSLMAGVAAVRAIPGTTLKWPNDVLVSSIKAGGILVERSEDVVAIGMGLNLWWPDRPEGFGVLFQDDPGPERHAELGALWGAELMHLIEGDQWPIAEYRTACATLGQEITWEPDGFGRAVDIDHDGALLVDTTQGVIALHSGAVRHIRPK